MIPKNTTVTGTSLIEFRSTNHTTLPLTDWIFFTSKQSVRSFFELKLPLSNQRIACIGQGTARVLAQHVNQINFIGNAVNIENVANSFVELIGDQTCLFPISNISKRTVQKAFKKPENAIDFEVYQTIEKQDTELPFYDVLIFTSPSNVRAYFRNNTINKDQTVIAIGPSTGNQLRKYDVQNFFTPKTSGEIGLIDCLLNR